MAPRLAILTTLALFLFSGCIGEQAATADDAAAPPGTTQDADESAPAQPQPAPATPPTPPAEPEGCKANGNNSNYGVQATIGGTYVMSRRSGNLLVVYEESNGRRGLQTEEECPTAPDQKLAEVPEALAEAFALKA